MGFRDKLTHAWNAFVNNGEEQTPTFTSFGTSYGGSRPGRSRSFATNDKSIVTSIYTRIAVDVAAVAMKHVRLDTNGRFAEEIQSGLNYCLNVEANIDQGGRAFRQDMAMTLLEKGFIAVVPVDTSINPTMGGFDIKTVRVGEVVAWYPRHVRVSLWNDKVGRREEVVLPKETVALIENPMFAVMNEPNSTLQRLIRKLALLDAVDEQSGSGRLDLIIQLPYVIKSDARKSQAEARAKDIEMQLKGSQYGIAYTDGTEKITQLNRPAENNMLAQIEYLTTMLHGELGITEEVMNGTADEKTMLNYHNRTVEPILGALSEGLKRAFLTKTAMTQRQSIEYYPDPFRFVPISSIADIADKFARNEILSSNEVRGIIGMAPSSDPKADQLRNSNMPQPQDLGELKPVPPRAAPPQLAIDQ